MGKKPSHTQDVYRPRVYWSCQTKSLEPYHSVVLHVYIYWGEGDQEVRLGSGFLSWKYLGLGYMSWPQAAEYNMITNKQMCIYMTPGIALTPPDIIFLTDAVMQCTHILRMQYLLPTQLVISKTCFCVSEVSEVSGMQV